MKQRLERDHFARVCCDNPKEYNRSTKLHRARFRQYLSARYGPFIADKYQNLLNFENPITFEGYQKQIFYMFKDKELLYQVSFDFYDAANDDKISSLDIYRIIQYYCKGAYP